MNSDYRIDVDKIFEHHPYAREILGRLNAAGYKAVLIGGVVRDAMRSILDPSIPFSPHEVDIATSALPQEVRRLFRDRPIVGVGEEFGVLVIAAPDGQQYEVATFRTEGDYDGRWPGKVELVRDLAGDVNRRDLTINGLAATCDGTVIDLVGGIEDLKAGRIRAIGDPQVRFAEDYLRMLRTVRFACRIDGVIDPATAAAIAENAGKIESISWERIRDELLRTLATPAAARGIELLDQFGLLSRILPEVTAMKGVPQPEEYHPEGDVYVHTLLAVRIADQFVHDPLVKLAILLHDLGKPKALARNEGANMGGHDAIGARMTRRIGMRLRMSRHEIARLVFLVKNHMRIADFPKMGRGKQVRFVSDGMHTDGMRSERISSDDNTATGEMQQAPLRDRYPLFFDLLQVLVADCEACAHKSSGWAPILQETLRVVNHMERVCDLKKARALVDGHVLIEMGATPGPRLGKVLEEVHDRILSGEICAREEAIAAAMELFSGDLKGKEDCQE
ncbi:MAG: CCA tRNA nucleotidyltransferase [Candidatus Bipolaricaulota bacterium]|nr:CCA tRNA nucleotidyltransferase [Candidatus Bipolaricaulota bacterium]